MTGYAEPPAGVELRDGMAYNPYFTGGALSMTQQLFDEQIEYEDGENGTMFPVLFDSDNFLGIQGLKRVSASWQRMLQSFCHGRQCQNMTPGNECQSR